ncbi:MAG: N-acetyltransferase family protein [Pirellulales bacterium]
MAGLAAKMNVRDARESDLGSLAELLLLVHQMHLKAQPGTYRDISHASALEFLAPRLTESTAYLRVAEVESEVQGYCSAAIQSSPSIPMLQPGEFIYINEIVVRPGSRRSGVGRALVGDLKEFARERGVAQIKLDVGHFNSEARAFFQSQGFEVLRERMSARVDR